MILRRSALLLPAFALVACSSAGAVPDVRGATHPVERPVTAAATQRDEPAPTTAPELDTPASPRPSPAEQAHPTPDPQDPTTPHPSPSASTPFEPDDDAYDVTAVVTPTCVRRGETATIVITTVPDAGVAYNAVYAHEEGGAPPPYGEGHGGNDGGQTGADGHWEDTWTVGPSAPSGPARVDVVVGRTDGYGRTVASFAVADLVTGRCG